MNLFTYIHQLFQHNPAAATLISVLTAWASAHLMVDSMAAKAGIPAHGGPCEFDSMRSDMRCDGKGYWIICSKPGCLQEIELCEAIDREVQREKELRKKYGK